MSKIPEPSVLLKNPCGGTRGMNPKEEWRRGPDPEHEREEVARRVTNHRFARSRQTSC
jgi:hypothetical protein